MYSVSSLANLAQKLEDKYEDAVLENSYKNELFHSHLSSAIENLRKAGELVGDCEPEEEPNESCFSPSAIESVLIFAFFIIILFALIG